jgi:hypothetical protein
MLGLGMGLWQSARSGGADTTAPTLSSPVGTQTGSTTATIGATTDEGNGTFYGVVTTSSTQPSVAQIEAGQDAAGSAAAYAGSVSVSSTGAKTLSATGLTASTGYYAHLEHKDAAGNHSNRVTSAQFTTAGTFATLSSAAFDKYAGITLTAAASTWCPISSAATRRSAQPAKPGPERRSSTPRSTTLRPLPMSASKTGPSISVLPASRLASSTRPDGFSGSAIPVGRSGTPPAMLQSSSAGALFVTNDILSVVLDKTNGTLAFFRTHTGTTTQVGTTVTGVSLSHYYAWGGGSQPTNGDMTFNFGATTLASTGTGASAY